MMGTQRQTRQRITRLFDHLYPTQQQQQQGDHHHHHHNSSNNNVLFSTCKAREEKSSNVETHWNDLFSLILFVMDNIVLVARRPKASAAAAHLSMPHHDILQMECAAGRKGNAANSASVAQGSQSSSGGALEQQTDTDRAEMGHSRPSFLNKIIRSFQGSGPLSTDSIQAFNNILFLVNSIPPSLNSLGIFNIMLRSAKPDSDLLPFLAQVKIPKSALGGADYKTFISTLSQVQMYLPAWYYSSLVLAKALNNFDSILLYCAQRFSREIKVKKAIVGALIYPAIMTTMGLAGLALLLTRILPQNIQIFESMGLTVPGFLQVTNFLVRCVQYHWLALLYIIPASLSAQYLPFRAYLKWEYLKLHTPIGHLRFLQDKATLLHMLSLLDKEQIGSKLLLVCTNISGNVILQHMIESMAAMAKYGASADEILAYLLKQKHVFSPYEIAYLQACFLGGKHSIVQDGLKYVSQMVLQEYTASLQTVLKVLGPATIAIVGVLVVIVALIGIYPQIELSSTVSAR